MDKKESAVNDNDLEIVEIAEFKRGSVHKKIAMNEERKRRQRRRFYGITAVYALGFSAAILLGIFVLHMPVPVVCVILTLEALIAASFYDLRVWVQILVIAVGVAVGVIFGRLPLMILGGVVYLGAALTLHGMKRIL